MRDKKFSLLHLSISVVFFSLFGLVLFWANQGQMPALVSRLYSFPLGDKIGHFCLMGLLGLSLNLLFSFHRWSVIPGSIFTGSLVAFCFVTLEEVSQLFFPARSFSLADLSFSYLGIFSLDLALRKLKK